MTGLTFLIIILVIASGVIVGIISSRQGYDKGIEKGEELIRKLYGIDETINPKKCKVCNYIFDLDKRYMYIAREVEELGFAASLGTKKEPKMYEAIDCPKCGCQNILSERQRGIGRYKDVVEHYEEEKEIEIMDLSKD